VIYDDKQYKRMMRIFKSFNEAHTIVFKVMRIGIPIFYVHVAYRFWRSQEWAGLGMSTLVRGFIGGVIWNAEKKYRKVMIALESKDYAVERTRCSKISVRSSGDDKYSLFVNILGYDKAIELDSWYKAGWHGIQEGDEVDVIETMGERFVIKAL